MSELLRAPLRQQMVRVSQLRQRRIQDSRVERLLTMLRDENLTTRAALDLKSQEGIRLDCVFADEVWDDPRVTGRIAQLGKRGVKVEKVYHEHTVGGRDYRRAQLLVTFAGD